MGNDLKVESRYFMLVAERHQKIVELVNERKSIRVTELSRIFSITEETIRRDLENLEKQGKLQRSHGGAVSISSQRPEISYLKREIIKDQKSTRLNTSHVATA